MSIFETWYYIFFNFLNNLRILMKFKKINVYRRKYKIGILINLAKNKIKSYI